MDLVDVMKSGCSSEQLGEIEFKILGRVYLTGDMSSEMSRVSLVGINPATQRLQILSIEGVADTAEE